MPAAVGEVAERDRQQAQTSKSGKGHDAAVYRNWLLSMSACYATVLSPAYDYCAGPQRRNLDTGGMRIFSAGWSGGQRIPDQP